MGGAVEFLACGLAVTLEDKRERKGLTLPIQPLASTTLEGKAGSQQPVLASDLSMVPRDKGKRHDRQ